jgi:hypothetical protein
MIVASGYLAALTGSSNAVVSGALHQFTLEDTSGSGSTGFFRLGLAFEPGEVPSGTLPRAKLGDGTIIRSAVIEPNRWSDGSMRKCTLVGEVPGGVTGSAMVNVVAEPGVQAASGVDPWAYLDLNTDCRVWVTNHSGSASGALPDRTYALNDAIAVTTRRQIQADTPVCIRAFAWGHPSGEKHLVCLHYVDLWLNNSGQVVGVEWTPVLSQHWWVDDPFGDGAATKEQRTYDASVQDGATVLAVHQALEHAYYCQWAALRTADDDQHGRRLWLDRGAAMPTLNLAYALDSKRRMMRAAYFPPLRHDVSFDPFLDQRVNGPLTLDYVPLGDRSPGGTPDIANVPCSHGHRHAINAPGAYRGRGFVTNMDSVALLDQTPARWRLARVGAQAALSVYHHIKDHRDPGSGPFAGDASMGMFPQPINKLGPQSYPGLAGETWALSSPAGADIAEDRPDGGTGAFFSWDTAHHVIYGYLMAFVEGERYLLDATLDQYNFYLTQGAKNSNTRNPNLLWGGSSFARKDALGIPVESNLDQRWGSIAASMEQERSFGWGIYSIDAVYALLPAGDRRLPCLENLSQNQSDWFEAEESYFPAAQQRFGMWFWRSPPIVNPWMNAIGMKLCMRHRILMETASKGQAGYDLYIDYVARYLARAWANKPGYVAELNDCVNEDDTGGLTFLPENEYWVGRRVTNVNDVFSFFNNTGYLPADGERARITDASNHPPEFVPGQEYFVVNVVQTAQFNVDFQLAATPGGTPLTSFTDQSSSYLLPMTMASFDLPQKIDDAPLPTINDDSTISITYSSAEYAYGVGHPDFPQALIDDIRAFMAPTSWDRYATWYLNGDLMS